MIKLVISLLLFAGSYTFANNAGTDLTETEVTAEIADLENRANLEKKTGTKDVQSPAGDESSGVLSKFDQESNKSKEKQTAQQEANAAAGAIAGASSISGTEKAESEIPVLQKTSEKNPKSSPSPWKMVMSLGLVAVALGAAVWAAKRWMSKKSMNNPHTSIKVITQHYLGPKKSLMVIRVAGESILIGVTDSNINLIKSLSLMDDELPDQIPAKFENSLDQMTINQDDEADNSDEYSVKGVRDIVGTKLKGMRNLW